VQSSDKTQEEQAKNTAKALIEIGRFLPDFELPKLSFSKDAAANLLTQCHHRDGVYGRRQILGRAETLTWRPGTSSARLKTMIACYVTTTAGIKMASLVWSIPAAKNHGRAAERNSV